MKLLFLLLGMMLVSCAENETTPPTPSAPRTLKYLALGDSYTIGEGVCNDCRFPLQLQDSLTRYLGVNDQITTRVIAQTGWTTSNLKNAVITASLPSDFDLVTLLIGVNNQYQNLPFSLYETELPELITLAVAKAKGNKNNVLVVSIPDLCLYPFWTRHS